MRINNTYETGLSDKELQDRVVNPRFEDAGKIHDWRNHVLESWVENWTEFSVRERELIIIMAEQQANKEEWD